DHDPVDLVVELLPLPLPDAAGLGDGVDRLEALRERVDAEAVAVEPAQRLPVRRRLALAGADAVRPDRERAAGRDRRVLLAQRPGGRVARVRRRLLLLGD